MAPKDDDKLSEILIHVGETRKGIDNLETNVKDIRDTLTGLNSFTSTLDHTTVKLNACDARHEGVKSSIDHIQTDMTEVRNYVKKFNEDRPCTTCTAQHTTKPKRDPKYWVSLLVGISTLLVFLGSALWGVVTVGRYVEKIDAFTSVSKAKPSKSLKTMSRRPASAK